MIIVDGIKITADEGITSDEIEDTVQHEKNLWRADGNQIATIELKLDGDKIVLAAIEKSPVKRVRSITGYLSNIESFNDAKQAECRDRVSHETL
jgi:Oxygen-sensitive ribonucleoside-triphosphate reductase